MKDTKTTLQKIIEQKTDQIRIAIEEAIDDGGEIKEACSVISYLKCCYIDGLFMQKRIDDGEISVELNFFSDKIAKLFEPSKHELEKLAEQKRAELEEIENQIKEREAQQ